MPLQEITINPVSRVDRRNPKMFLGKDMVSLRENFIVEGEGNNKQNKKIPGSDRWNSSEFTGNATWIDRYYSGEIAKSFFFSSGTLYHIDPAGTVTSKITSLNSLAQPVSEIMKVASNNIMYFSDGFNGMYSYDGNIGHNWQQEELVEVNFVGMVSHIDRMFGFEEDSEDLYFSANLDPINYTSAIDSGIITIGAKRGSKIQALALLNETLYIFKEDAIFVLEGRTPQTFQVRQVHGAPGTPARFSVVNVESGIIYMDQDYEFREFNGTTTTLLSYNMAVGGDLTKDLNPLINKNRVSQCKAIYHNRLYRCSFVETGETTNNLEYIFNTINQTDAITRGNNVNAYSAHTKVPDKNELVTARSDAGYLMYQYRGINWDNQATSPTMPIKLESTVNSGIANSRFKYLWANMRVLGADLVTVKTQMDTRLSATNESSSTIDPQGETKNITNFIRVNNQDNMTDRLVLPWSNSKGQALTIKIEMDENDIDVSLISWVVGVIVKENKRRKHIGV